MLGMILITITMAIACGIIALTWSQSSSVRRDAIRSSIRRNLSWPSEFTKQLLAKNLPSLPRILTGGSMKHLEQKSWSERTNRQIVHILSFINALFFAIVVTVGTLASIVFGYSLVDQGILPNELVWLPIVVGILLSVAAGALFCGIVALLLTAAKDFERLAAANELSAESLVTNTGIQARLGETAARRVAASERLTKSGETFARAHLAIAKELHAWIRDADTGSDKPRARSGPVRPKR
jgi:hypothetical protein